MASIRNINFKFVFSVFFVAILLKVSTITDAIPLADLCKLGGLSIDGADLADLDIPKLLLEAADTSEKSTAAKIEEVGEEVVAKMNEFYDLLAESQLIQIEEEEIQQVDTGDTDYLAARDVPTDGSVSVAESVANEVRQKALNKAISRSQSAGEAESEPDKTAAVDSESDASADKLESDKSATEDKYYDATTSQESANSADDPKSEQENVGEKIKKVAQDVAEKMQTAGKKIKEHTGRAVHNMKRFYNERLKRRAEVDPETGALIEGKEKMTFGKRMKQFSDNVKSRLAKWLNFKVQLIVDVKPISG